MLAPTASAGVVNDVLSTWNLHVSECDENPIELPATLNVAMFEAVNRIAGKYTAYLEPAPASASGSMEAAAAAAAHAVLVAFCADQSEVYDKALTTALAGINDAAARDAGVSIGKAAAAAVMAHRADAGANLDDPVFESPAAGVYVPTVERVGVNLARARPWVMTAADEVRSPAPPALTSAAWARDFNEIKRLGSKKSDARTAAQTDIGKFWGGRSVRIVLPQLIGRPGRTLVDDARFLALANMAWVDSYIAMMDGKYAFNLWRPVTAIRFAATDGNDQTEADAQWTPLTRNHTASPRIPMRTLPIRRSRRRRD